MALQRRGPFAELRHADETLERLWGSIGVRTVDGGKGGWSVPLDYVQGGDNIPVHASLPGVKPEDIQVTIENDILTIKGEATTSYEHGILTVTFPKMESKRANRLEVKLT